MTGDAGGSLPRSLPVPCGRDGHQHLVADEAIDAGHAGRYEALCQHQVWAVAAAYPTGPPCPHCVAVREGRTGGRRSAPWRKSRHRRTNQAGMLARLISQLRGRAHPAMPPLRRTVPR